MTARDLLINTRSAVWHVQVHIMHISEYLADIVSRHTSVCHMTKYSKCGHVTAKCVFYRKQENAASTASKLDTSLSEFETFKFLFVTLTIAYTYAGQ